MKRGARRDQAHSRRRGRAGHCHGARGRAHRPGVRGRTRARRRAAVLVGREPAFDLIVLDVMLPKKDGFDVCRELRALGVRTPILMLTAKTAGGREGARPRDGRRRLRDEAVPPSRSCGRGSRRCSGAGRSRRRTVYRFGELEVNFVAPRADARRAVDAPHPARVQAARGLRSPSRPRAQRVSASSTRCGATTRSSPTASWTTR